MKELIAIFITDDGTKYQHRRLIRYGRGHSFWLSRCLDYRWNERNGGDKRRRVRCARTAPSCFLGAGSFANSHRHPLIFRHAIGYFRDGFLDALLQALHVARGCLPLDIAMSPTLELLAKQHV